jgi:hypothetical protein
MTKAGRNDPCPCGSGKKYKQCCLKAGEAQQAGDRIEAVPKAIQWLTATRGQAVREALDEGFFGGLDEEEYQALMGMDPDVLESVMINAMEWLLADGLITVKGQERRVSELLLARGGPLLSAEQRQWIELLASKPLRLYEVAEAVPGESMRLQDLLLPGRAPVLVQEKTGSQQAVRFDLIAGRIIPVASHFELSGAVYAFPRHRSDGLIAELRHELEGIGPDSPLAKEATSGIIPRHWLKLFVTPSKMPQFVDSITGEPILLVTDHYRVKDWQALEQALSGEADVAGNRRDGWERLFEGGDGLERSSAAINPGKHQDRLSVFYHTQPYADIGRPWFEGLAGQSVGFVSREITDPKGAISKRRTGDAPAPPAPPQLPPEVMTELLGKHIRQFYRHWADQPLPALGGTTPREAIETAEGLEQVKFLLHSYEHGEARQAKNENREPVSYDFLWQDLGVAP